MCLECARKELIRIIPTNSSQNTGSRKTKFIYIYQLFKNQDPGFTTLLGLNLVRIRFIQFAAPCSASLRVQ
jgi:hypothetical protein